MSGGYYKDYANQNYHHESSSEAPQYMHQNYGYNQNQGFVAPYQNNLAFTPVSEEYLRQPATSPYATAPMPMPQPVVVPAIVRMTEPSPAPMQEPRVIIVHNSPARDNNCCGVMCRFIDCLLTKICSTIAIIIFIILVIGLGLWLSHKF